MGGLLSVRQLVAVAGSVSYTNFFFTLIAGFGSAPSSPGSLAMFAAIRRASSRVMRLAVVRRPDSLS
jgi:hypothetical protein